MPLPLALLLGVAALLSVAWAFTTAPFQGPDEPAHFNYAQHLAETGHKPAVLQGDHPDSSVVFQALFFLNLDQLAGVSDARPAWSKLEEKRFQSIVDDYGDRGEKDGAGPNPLAKNPPLYYALEGVPYRVGSAGSFWDRLMLMRLSNGLLLLLTVTFAWLAAAEVFASAWPRVLTAGCVALLPQLSSISGSINADNLLITEWTAFTWLALRLMRQGPTRRRVLALCVTAAASLVTHGRGLAIVVPLLVVLGIAVVRARQPLRRVLAWLAPGVVVLAAVFATYQLLLVPTGGAYGGEVNLTPGGVPFSIRGLISNTWQFYFPRLPLMSPRLGPGYGYEQMFIESFFGRFASLEVAYGRPVYQLIQDAAGLGLIALVWLVVRRWAALRARWPQLAALVAVTVSMLGLLHVASYRALLTGPDPLITGRYLLPLVAVFGLTVAFVISSLRPRASAVLGSLVLAGLLALNLSGLMLTLARFYG